MSITNRLKELVGEQLCIDPKNIKSGFNIAGLASEPDMMDLMFAIDKEWDIETTAEDSEFTTFKDLKTKVKAHLQ